VLSGFLSELGKKFAERWFTLLVLPGALYLAVAAAARVMGYRHALDVARLTERLSQWAADPTAGTVGAQVVLFAAVLGGSAVAGIAAQALSSAMERAVLAVGWRDLRWDALRRRVERRVAARRNRWSAAAGEWRRQRAATASAVALGRSVDHAPMLAAQRTMLRTAVEEPDRPTWCGDRLNAVALRLDRDLRMDLAVCWPHLWLVLPETSREQVTAARQELTRATTLAAWAVLYFVLLCWWWPAVPLAAVLAGTAWHRTRAATEGYARLLEAVCRLHLRDLAEHLGLDTDAAPQDVGAAVTRLLEGSPPPVP
jgi:hypothetical protein